ncbi:uncharacterized protein SCHCODRAFT_01146571 [Schizophyllum commune H4-8]|uniref:F-box domain-containing protein n=1 Tax=Schizophyllum commune (strain H4-8 / FGSC 9210) TaxID=578458 RepID=D8PSY9_SCHCM|nr:uncharacterized protein SCHCODRAFT_01146571 [Schizophyllum commune H4-8]KAI5899497.1 hypothetical protein SCHCODRAFT_01146571 [Schizophyllum commune H4-8]
MAPRCLEIPEILLLVCAELRTSKRLGTLASLASTCSAMREPALDVLWEEQDSIVPLLQTLSQDRVSESVLTLERYISQADWDHMQYYARRIKRLTLEADDGMLCGIGSRRRDEDDDDDDEELYDEDRDYSIETSTLELLQSRAGHEPLLPNLRHLDYGELDSSWLPFITLFVNPSLQSLRIRPSIEDESMNILATLPSLCPNLITFNANWEEVNDGFCQDGGFMVFEFGDDGSDGGDDDGSSSSYADNGEFPAASELDVAARAESEDPDKEIENWQAAMRETFCRWNSLVSLDLPDADPVILAHFGKSPVLETLKLAVLFEADWKHATEPAFPNLAHLKITTATPLCPPCIIRSLSSKPLHLKSIEITCEDLHGGDADENRRRVLDAIAECIDPATLQRISYLQVYRNGPFLPTHWRPLPGDSIVQLTRFPKITHFDVHCWVDVQDEDIAMLAAAWPKLRVFSLDVKHPLHLGRARAVKPTINCLNSLATACPRLFALGLVLDAMDVPDLPEPHSDDAQTRKRKSPLILHLYGSPIKNANKAADYICSVFHKYANIKFGHSKWSDGQASPHIVTGELTNSTFFGVPLPTLIDRTPKYSAASRKSFSPALHPASTAARPVHLRESTMAKLDFDKQTVTYSKGTAAALLAIFTNCQEQLAALYDVGPSDNSVLAIRVLHVLQCSKAAVHEAIYAEWMTSSEEQRNKLAEYYWAEMAGTARDVYGAEMLMGGPPEPQPEPPKKKKSSRKGCVMMLSLSFISLTLYDSAARRTRKRQV